MLLDYGAAVLEHVEHLKECKDRIGSLHIFNAFTEKTLKFSNTSTVLCQNCTLLNIHISSFKLSRSVPQDVSIVKPRITSLVSFNGF